MTNPEPARVDFTELANSIRSAPRWLIVSVVVAGGLLVWFMVRGRERPDAEPVAWRTRAVELLVERGYNRQAAIKAVNAYSDGGHMTPEDVTLIAIVIRTLGTPSLQTSSEQMGGSSSTQPATAYPGDGDSLTAYWYVPVAPAGWSSTFGGISMQFYGDTSRGALLQQANPNLSNTTYGKLPVGAVVKVPR